jgi:predicted O-methyltransferase YrrM
MFTNQNEEEFFFKSINKNSKILEYGSGVSTFEIAKICEKITSIEHQKHWYEQLNNSKPDNCEIIFEAPNLPYIEGITCGSYEEFKSYIEAPITKGPFDVILIDGRARVACASICNKLSHENTIVFIHDFNREEYLETLKYLDLIEQVDTMAKFKIKK